MGPFVIEKKLNCIFYLSQNNVTGERENKTIFTPHLNKDINMFFTAAAIVFGDLRRGTPGTNKRVTMPNCYTHIILKNLW